MTTLLMFLLCLAIVLWLCREFPDVMKRLAIGLGLFTVLCIVAFGVIALALNGHSDVAWGVGMVSSLIVFLTCSSLGWFAAPKRFC